MTIAKIDPKRITSHTVFYNEYGQESDLTSQTACAIKIYFSNGQTVYKVKSNRLRKFYDPRQKNSKYGLNLVDKTVGGALFKFKDAVSEQCFNKYIKFLQKRTETLLTQAERLL